MPVKGSSLPRQSTPLARWLPIRLGRKGWIAVIAALAVLPVAAAIHQPLYVALDRDAAVTSVAQRRHRADRRDGRGPGQDAGPAGWQGGGSRADRELQHRPWQRDQGRGTGTAGGSPVGASVPDSERVTALATQWANRSAGPATPRVSAATSTSTSRTSNSGSCCKEKGWRFPRRPPRDGGHCERPGPDRRPTRIPRCRPSARTR